MAAKPTGNVDKVYCFYPLTQSYGLESAEGISEDSSVYIVLSVSEKIPAGKLTEIIKKLGNYLTLNLLQMASTVTKHNNCTDYKAHVSTCEQEKRCKRHLTKEEVEECQEMEKEVELCPKGIHYKGHNLNIPQGDIEQMRRILEAMRRAIKQK